jgi:orotidine-5'-phosphate decarboxylase
MLKSPPPISLQSPLMVALDVDSEAEVERLVAELADVAGCFKLGPRLIHRYGENLVRRISQNTPVFVDCKFFDIPSTMEAAIRATFQAGATFATIHAMAGPTALKHLAHVEAELNQQRPFKILAVTILTSWGDHDFSGIYQSRPVLAHVRTLAEEVKAAGLTGLVCSPHELESLQDLGLYLVTPGVRLDSDSSDDQNRIMTPTAAIRKGASAFVVGRPIVKAASPREAALGYAVEAL